MFWGTTSAASRNVTRTTEDHVQAMIDWLRSRGGTFNKKLEIRRADPDDSESRFGMFAKHDIVSKEVLLDIPPSCLFTSGPPLVGDRVIVNFDESGEWSGAEVIGVNSARNKFHVLYDDGYEEKRVPATLLYKEDQQEAICGTIHNLIEEMKLGDQSEFAPYVNYLLDLKPGQIPSAWSQAGQDLLNGILRTDLPPEEATGWSMSEMCGVSDDPFDQNAAFIQVWRSWDDVLIPVFDFMSHRNGHYLNTENDNVLWSKPVLVRASRDIAAGEELYTSYNFCPDCGARAEYYGTAEIFRDYGFVEEFPQRWFFPKHDIAFSLEEEAGYGGLRVDWLQPKPSGRGIAFMERQIQRLKEILAADLTSLDLDIPNEELDVIEQYCDALIVALSHAIDSLGNLEQSQGPNCSANSSETCNASRSARHELDDDDEEEESDFNYGIDVCETGFCDPHSYVVS